MTNVEILRHDAPGTDVSALFAIESACFGDQAWSYDSINTCVIRDDITTSVVRVDGTIVAFSCAMHVCDECEIFNVATHPSFRNRGFARTAIVELLDHCRAYSIRRALLEVRESNLIARRLYESLGFTRYNTRAGYYSAPKEDAILMEKLL